MSDLPDSADEQPPPSFDFTGIPETTHDLQKTSDWFVLPDNQLQRMSQWANQTGEGIGVTVVVAGGTISGTIVSAASYYEGLSAQFLEAIAENGDEKQSTLATEYAEFFFDEPGKRCADQVEADNQAYKDGKLTEPRHMMARYIHLKDARYSVPGTSNLALGYTRVRLSQVAAWAVGQRWVGNA